MDGGGAYGITNRNSVSIELCINSNGNYAKTFVNGAELAAHMLKTLGLPISRMKRHYDASRKNCPGSMSANNWAKWNEFVAKVESIMNGNTSSSTTTDVPSTSEYKVGSYQKDVKITAEALNVRDSRGIKGSVIGQFTKGQIVNVWYIDKAEDGSLWGSCNCNGKTGYIHLGYTEPVSGGSTTTSKPTTSTPNPAPAVIGVGSKVKITGNYYATGETIPSSVKSATYTVQQMGTGKALLKEIVSWVKTSDLVIAGTTSTSNETVLSRYPESGTVKVLSAKLNVRNVPSATGNDPVDYYVAGNTFSYDTVVITDKYVYVSYMSYTGIRRYVAVKDKATGERFGNCY